jgi:hypothetical protein
MMRQTSGPLKAGDNLTDGPYGPEALAVFVLPDMVHCEELTTHCRWACFAFRIISSLFMWATNYSIKALQPTNMMGTNESNKRLSHTEQKRKRMEEIFAALKAVG